MPPAPLPPLTRSKPLLYRVILKFTPTAPGLDLSSTVAGKKPLKLEK
jgi:hypothetical protein